MPLASPWESPSSSRHEIMETSTRRLKLQLENKHGKAAAEGMMHAHIPAAPLALSNHWRGQTLSPPTLLQTRNHPRRGVYREGHRGWISSNISWSSRLPNGGRHGQASAETDSVEDVVCKPGERSGSQELPILPHWLDSISDDKFREHKTETDTLERLTPT